MYILTKLDMVSRGMAMRLLDSAESKDAANKVAEADATGFVTKISEFFQKFTGVVAAVVVIALIVLGFCFMIPSEKTKSFAKDHIAWVIIGAAIALSATVIANSLTSSF